MRNGPPPERLEYARRTHSRREYWLPVVITITVIAAIAIVATSIVLPKLSARDRRRQLECLSHLHQLGDAAIMYANQHNMKMPDDLQAVIDADLVRPDALVCPASNLPSLSGATTQAADAAIKSNQVSYIYLGKGLRADAPADTVLMYEPLSDHEGRINVLFFNSHIESLNLAEAKKLIARIGSGQNPVRYPDPASATQP